MSEAPSSIFVRLARARIRQIEACQRDAFRQAGEYMADAIADDRLIYVFGAGGHTSLVSGELFFRVGGLANIPPIAEYGLTSPANARTFLALERCEGLGNALIRSSSFQAGDVLLVFHTIGVNATCIDAAQEAKRLGALVVGIASSQWQALTPKGAPIRHSSGKNLRETADVFLDDCNPIEDAAVWLEGLDVPAAALSGIGTFAAAHLLELEAIRQCLARGLRPPVWSNANSLEGEQANRALQARYQGRIPML